MGEVRCTLKTNAGVCLSSYKYCSGGEEEDDKQILLLNVMMHIGLKLIITKRKIKRNIVQDWVNDMDALY